MNNIILILTATLTVKNIKCKYATCVSKKGFMKLILKKVSHKKKFYDALFKNRIMFF